MGVSAEEQQARGLGLTEFPHVHQISSHLLATPEKSKDPNDPDSELHLYEVIDVIYQVGTPPEDGPSDGLRQQHGWEIMVENLDPRRDIIYPNQ